MAYRVDDRGDIVMSKYIKLDDAIDALYSGFVTKTYIENKLKDLPTIDIVHCKDCRLVTYTAKDWRTHEIFYACPYSGIQHEGKFFCAYGERIEE